MGQGRRIFISYSTKDAEAANAICAALEKAGISCWIAPRDITAGAQWGGSIVSAVETASAVVVVFTQNANESPQIAREMEVAVSKRLPLIPIRIANVMPTEDMQYFLGVSHWFNAYPKPIETYLPQIVASVQRVLANADKPWKRIQSRLPQGRTGQLAMGGAAALLIALATAWMVRPAQPDYLASVTSPLEGRWQADIADAQGKKQTCLWDIQQMGQAVFSDSCPMPFMGSHGTVSVTKDGTFGAALNQADLKEGVLSFLGGTANGYTAKFHKTLFGSLVTEDAQHGELTWSKVSASGPLPDASKDILPKSTAWPLEDVPGIVKRATAYARAHWKPDALLMDFKAELSNQPYIASLQTTAGNVALTFVFYSPSTQEGLNLMPGSQAGDLYPEGVVDRDPRYAIPDNFLDLPKAVEIVRARGVRGKQIKSAELENYGRQTYYGDVTVNGVAWVIDTALGERRAVAASLK